MLKLNHFQQTAARVRAAIEEFIDEWPDMLTLATSLRGDEQEKAEAAERCLSEERLRELRQRLGVCLGTTDLGVTRGGWHAGLVEAFIAEARDPDCHIAQ